MSSLMSSQQSCLANALFVSTQRNSKLRCRSKIPIFCGQKPEDLKDSSVKRKSEKLAKLAVVGLAAGLLTVGSVSDAMAAKSGGRIGGQAFRSPAPRSAPRINNNNSRTNIYVNPRVAPPLVGGYGYGYGYGWSPFSFFAPGPGVVVGAGGGFDSLAFFLFLGAAAAVVRNLGGSRRRDDDGDDDY